MHSEWRRLLGEQIKNRYVRGPREWFEINLSPAGTLSLTIVSDQFSELSLLEERRKEVERLVRGLAVPFALGFLSLYTVHEAESIGLTPSPSADERSLYTWHDLAHWTANDAGPQRISDRGTRIPRTIVFYSFKGGVGRTTALIHAAWTLATRGRKVVAVDLDLEAPGLGSVLELVPPPKYGLVDYFYERAYLPDGSEPTITVTEIFGEVKIPEAPGRFFVVPAGSLDMSYVAKVDDLRATTLTASGDDLWSVFVRDIQAHLRPDVILVDSRTGLNAWGALSLLRAADEAIVFLYPNQQNLHGVKLLIDSLTMIGPSINLVFSPVPLVDESGMEKVKAHWVKLVGDSSAEPVADDRDTDENASEPLVVPYLPGIALADRYPVPALLPYYDKIANLIDEDTTVVRVSKFLSDPHIRWRIIESLTFPQVDAKDPRHDLREVFQRTADFERFLDETTCLIRGKKGTGKSALYWLLLKHDKTARELARGRLDRVTCLSGHGKFSGRPTRDEFRQIDQELDRHGGSWEAFWRSYLILQLHLRKHLPLPRGRKFQRIRAALSKVPKTIERWQIEHTQFLMLMSTDGELKLLAKDVLNHANEQLRLDGKSLWLLYDDLEEDLPPQGGVRHRALEGLFQLIQDADARRLTSIRFKVFLREDIWGRLVFDNKSHFNGRDLLLQWTRSDFLRLALRQAWQSKDFRELVSRFAPVESIDQADEDAIDRALQLLWGSRRERGRRSKYVSRWVYDRLTDASGTTFPRSLNILLRGARDHELTYKGQQHVPSPSDRLLRAQSLNAGLVEASRQRCDEIREEYPELAPLFDNLGRVPALATQRELRSVWEETVKDIVSTFDEFVDMLQNIGLATWRENEQRFRFADIYIYGFDMPRQRIKY